jgi:NACHT domain
LKLIEKWEVDYKTKLIYWLTGVAGSGKTTIAQTFAGRSSASGRLGASFFCSRDYKVRRNVYLIFPTLAIHLAYRYPEFRAELVSIISSSPDVCHESLDIQIRDFLVLPLQRSGIHTTIVIDALDECEKQLASALLSILARYISQIPFVKILITGRPEIPIRSIFRHVLQPYTQVFLLHDVDRGSVDQDIELYLRTGLSEIVAKRSDCDLTVPWPPDSKILAATKKCAGLFIVASVIIKFVAPRHHKPQQRLKIIINKPDSTVHEGISGADMTYSQVFVCSFADVHEDDTEFFDQLQLVVGSVVLVFDPLSRASLGTILDIQSSDVGLALRSLHSIIIVPDSELQPIRICHKSLADYLTDPNRCKDTRFYINPSISHLKLGIRCLQLMNCSLKKNICELPRYAMNADIEDLDSRREEFIGGGLEYACRSWAKHLRLGSSDGDNVRHAVQLLEDFFHQHFLQWLEVLSVVGDLRCAVYCLHDVSAWLLDVSTSLFFSPATYQA